MTELLPANKTRRINYISGGNGLAAIYVEEDNNNQLYYAYTDYLGSLTTLTDEQHSVIERHAFDPWGNRRNPADWTLADARTAWLTDRGYTMHEHLDDFALINMNSRVYDPQIARFLSPDPYVQSAGNWLSYNRYAYGYNNPMLFSDPSGEIPILAVAFLGGFINTAIQGAQGNLTSAGKFFGAFGIGAISGIAGAGAGSLAARAAGIVGLGGFAGGAMTGAAGGFAGGFVGGAGNAWAGGASFGQGLEQGIIGGGFGAITGGLIGGITSGIDAVRHEGNFWDGDGYTRKFGFKYNVKDFNGKQEPVTKQSIDNSIARKNYDRSGVSNFTASNTTPSDGRYGDATWIKGSRTTDITIYKPAFQKTELLDLVVGHEIMHAKFNTYFAQIPTRLGNPRTNIDPFGGTFLGKNMRFAWTNIQEDVILQWMHMEYIKKSLMGVGRNAVFYYTPQSGSPIINPY
jgi:RHS repeat-associated protein